MTNGSAVPSFQEVVEAQGHLIDSHVMELIFDKVVEYNGRFEVEEFRIGRTNDEPSYLRLKVEAPTREGMERMLQHLMDLGCSPVDAGDALLREVDRDRCAPEDFYSTTNHRTLIRHASAMGAGGRPADGRADRGQGRPRLLPPPARHTRRGRGRGRHARHPRAAGIQGARPAGLRLHVQRHLLGASSGDRRAADGRPHAADPRIGTEGGGGGRSGGDPHRRRPRRWRP